MTSFILFSNKILFLLILLLISCSSKFPTAMNVDDSKLSGVWVRSTNNSTDTLIFYGDRYIMKMLFPYIMEIQVYPFLPPYHHLILKQFIFPQIHFGYGLPCTTMLMNIPFLQKAG